MTCRWSLRCCSLFLQASCCSMHTSKPRLVGASAFPKFACKQFMQAKLMWKCHTLVLHANLSQGATGWAAWQTPHFCVARGF